MTEEKVKKREWVKNAAIIFLSVMLVLTFFSNTFMNYSLPEVSTQYVMSGSINEKIRGSGTVSANEEYIVEIDQSRKIETVCVQVGQTVNAGDILFILGEGDSEELDAAVYALEAAEIEYERAVLEAGRSKYSTQSEAVEDARDDLNEARDRADNIKKAEREISSAKSDYDAKAAKFAELKTHLEKLENSEGESEEIKQLKILLEDAENKLDAWKAEEAKCLEELSKITDTESKEYKAADEKYQTASQSVVSWQKAVDDYTEKLAALNVPGTPDPNEYNELYNQYVAAEIAMNNAEVKLNEVEAKYSKYAGESYESALDAVDIALEMYNEAKKALERAMEDGEIDEKLEELGLKQKRQEIEKLRENVAELSGGEGGKEITAKVGGVVAEINAQAGKTAEAGTALARIELRDRGFTLGVSVTAEQAKKVSVGDAAEVSTYWWGSEIKAVLKEIKNDAQSGGRNKILIFELSGDVEDGMNVDISIGQKGRSYDAIVPNSAVRSDSNGSFVLVLTTKSSPLGNRYSATRVDVQVLASDDVNSAVSGIGNGEYVITTASAPIEPGMLVRMAEG